MNNSTKIQTKALNKRRQTIIAQTCTIQSKTMSKILLLSGNKNQSDGAGNAFFTQAKTMLESYENEYTKFDFQSASLLDADVLQKAKSAHAILFFAKDSQEEKLVDSVRKNLNLYAQIACLSSRFDNVNNDICIVQDKDSGICNGEKGYADNPVFGREAYDTERYSELEIERTARVAYEIANTRSRRLTLCDKADTLVTSKLRRKIVADINEDYPFVSVDMQDVTDVLKTTIKNPTALDVVLTTSLFGDLLTSTAEALTDHAPSISFVGDTPLSMYGFCASNLSAISQPSISSLISFLLQNSFGIE